MSWEQRKGRTYYYAKRRVNGRVVSVYLGRGPTAQAAAEQAARLAEERREFQRRQRELQQQDGWIELHCQQIELAIAAELIAQGFHLHRGELRQTRTPGRPPTAEEPDDFSPKPIGILQLRPDPSPNSEQLTSALGELQSTLGQLDTVLDGVEIKNPKYINLLAKMKGGKPQQANPNEQVHPQTATTAATNSPAKLNVWQGQHVPAEKLRATRARLESAFARLNAPAAGAPGRYSSLRSPPGRTRFTSSNPSTKPPPS